MKILITEDDESYLYKGTDFHTKWGMIKKEDIENSNTGTILKTNKGKEFYLSETGFMDYYRRIRRGAQIITPKDIASIIANTGIGSNSRVLDSGSGSGGAACMLANIVKKVYSYEIREDHLKIVKQNMEMLGQTNIVLKHKDVYEKIDEKDLDLVLFDLPEPWKAIKNAENAIKSGGFLVCYSPNLTQVSKTVQLLRESKVFIYERTIENIEREWEVDEQKLRPKFKMLGHTAFLTFARRV